MMFLFFIYKCLCRQQMEILQKKNHIYFFFLVTLSEMIKINGRCYVRVAVMQAMLAHRRVQCLNHCNTYACLLFIYGQILVQC